MSFGTIQAEKMTTESGYSLGAGNASSFKNRLINGNMVIDQRNAGASYAQINATYSLDRWLGFSFTSVATTGKYTVQQNAGGLTGSNLPAGFTNYLGITSTAATATDANNIYGIGQRIEGFNTADLGWGTANAQTVTLSFWVRSSLTGTFGGSVFNGSGSIRSYPFAYTISAANTWEQKTVTIAGDTSGTWLTTNGTGLQLNFGIGVGSTYSGTAGAWAAATYYSATGATSVVGTSGATFYITGVQLEVGTVATSFDFRDYGRELILCQRYYTFLGGTAYACIASGMLPNTLNAVFSVLYPVVMRVAPSISFTNLIATDRTAYDTNVTAITGLENSPNGAYLKFALSSASGATGYGTLLAVQNATTGKLTLSSEL